MIGPDKLEALAVRMAKLGILEGDLEEKFILASGSGGQKVQKSHSAVYLVHTPTGIAVKCQKERSREMNRFFARRLLCDRFEEKVLQAPTEGQKKAEKIRRQKKRRQRKHTKKAIADEV